MPTGDTTSNAALEVPDNGQDDQTSQQPAKPTNWQDDPEYRKTQSKLQQQINEAKRAKEESDRQNTLQAQQNAYLAQQVRELQMRDMSQDEQVQFKLREKEQEAAYWKQQAHQVQQAQQFEEQKRNAIKDLLGDGDYPDVHEGDLMETRTATEAAKVAARLQRERSGVAAAEQDERRKANRTVSGGGKPPTGGSDWETRFNNARTAGELAALTREAQMKGR